MEDTTASSETGVTAPVKLTVAAMFKADVPTPRNKRVYPRAIVLRELGRLVETQVFGAFNTDSIDGLKLADISHGVVSGRILEDGTIEVDVQALSTPRGQELSKADPQKLYASLCGNGTAVADAGGNLVIQDDYKLTSVDVFDLVL